ncbi:MAG TPA: CDP-alcohol phosphatidyltransferase family protein [Acidimicrobiales bacterium]|nr:CDP-alcohol phosphatidyltransferase family protein [Acidimicrobiales bacterium]
MFDGRWRSAVDRNTGPVGKTLVRWGVTADILTASGLVFAVATAVVVATGHLLIGIPMLALTGFHDLLDGPVAKAGGTASVRGAFFDSVTDRVADAVLMGGVAWYLVSVHKGYLVLLPLAVLGAASLVSYERAKAEALGITAAKGGLMERAERMILLGAGFLAPWLLVPVLWVLLGLTLLTGVARFVRVWKAAEGPAPVARPQRPVRGTRSARPAGTSESRWQARRDAAAARGERSGTPVARWRARRQEALASRTGRARRARRAAPERTGSHRRPR